MSDPEPDQIDQMSEDELRRELRQILKEREQLANSLSEMVVIWEFENPYKKDMPAAVHARALLSKLEEE